MRAVLGSLAARLWAAQAALALAVAAVMAVAAGVEGHVPSPRSLLAAAPVSGAVLGAAWVLGRWRAEGGDVALANVGVPPGRVILWLALLSLPWLLAAPASRPPAAWTLEPGPAHLRVGLPGGELVVDWGAEGARRSDTGDVFADLPPPAAVPVPPRRGWLPRAARTAVLAALLAWLGLRRAPPGPALTLSGALIATALAHAVGALPP